MSDSAAHTPLDYSAKVDIEFDDGSYERRIIKGRALVSTGRSNLWPMQVTGNAAWQAEQLVEVVRSYLPVRNGSTPRTKFRRAKQVRVLWADWGREGEVA